MKYFQARKINHKPYLIFDLIAHNEEDLEKRNLSKKNHIISEDSIPDVKHGVCTKTLDEKGKIINRPKKELDQAKKEFEIEQAEKEILEVDKEVDKKISNGFEFDGELFSLSKNAQITWQWFNLSLIEDSFTDIEISTKKNGTYQLTKTNLPAFLTAAKTAVMDSLAEGREKKKGLMKIIGKK